MKESSVLRTRGAEPFEEKRMVNRPVKPMEEMLKEESKYEVDRLFPERTAKIPEIKELPEVTQENQKEPMKTEKTLKESVKIEEHHKKPEKREEQLKEASKMESPVQLSFLEEDIHTKDTRQDFTIIGQLFDTYWLMQKDDQFLIMDQHAAHEKVLFEKLMKAYQNQDIYEQQLMPPVILSLNLKEQDFVKNYEKMLKGFGFTLEEFGPDAYCLRTVPSNLFGMDAQAFFQELLDGMEEEAGRVNLDMAVDKIATMACKTAIKANQKISMEEAEALLLECEKLENPYTCPHGRPILISMTKKEIEKKFNRIK